MTSGNKEKIKTKIDKNIKEKARKIRRSNLFIIIVTIIIAIAIYYSYQIFSELITDKIIATSLRSMREISRHDEKSITSGLEHIWFNINGIAKEIKQDKFSSTSDMLKQLNIKTESAESKEIVLVTEEGKTFSSMYTVKEDKELLELCKNSGKDKFAYRKDDNNNAAADIRKEMLLLGSKIEPFTIDGNRFVYIVGYYEIGNLTDELKIESYGGEGYSSVIDQDGFYLVSVYRNNNLFERENFYTVLSKERISDGLTIEDVRKKIEARESFSLQYTLDGQERIMVCTPMSEVDWYCIMSVPLSICQEQSADLLQMLTILIVAVLITICVVIILVYRNKLQRSSMNFEIKHRDELEGALALAEQASRAKTTFLNNMSHDIRTPMNAIIGFTSLAKTHIDNKERVSDYLDKISQSSNHLLSLINDVLDMSRIESGKVSIEEKEENLAEILHSIENIIQADIDAKQMKFTIDTTNITDENIYCDKLRIKQILINLLSNSIKFTEPGGTISFHITQKKNSKKGYGTYEFRIKDNGIGISEEFLKEIFEPFARERNTTVSGIQGTGLGMAITKNIVDMMGGTIGVESEVGKGTEFIVTLELRLQEDQTKIEEKKEEEKVDFSGKRILLVEDNMMNREIATEYLTDFGFKIENAENGKEACDILENSEPGYFDIVLMDIQMPVMGGYEATRTIRNFKNKQIANIPILAMTANAFEEDKKAAKEAGMNGHLAKPIDIQILIETLKEILD